MMVGGWSVSDSLTTDDFKLSLDLDTITARMVALEEDATRHAVVGWLRQNGYTVIPPNEVEG